MLRRVFLALLMLLVAVPAAAMPLLHGAQSQTQATAMNCHETAPRKAHSPDGGAPVAQHDGICCAAFYGAPAIALPTLPPASPAPRALAMDGLAQPRAGPDAPPPKF
jgi:hypothetical protein